MGSHLSAAASTTVDPGPPDVGGSAGRAGSPTRIGSVAATQSRIASRS